MNRATSGATFSVIYVLSNIGSMCPVVIGGIALVAGYQVTFFILGVIGALGSIVYLILEKRAFGPLGMEPDDPLPPAERKKAVALLIAFFLAAVCSICCSTTMC